MPTKIMLNETVVATEGVVEADLGGEMVLLDVESGEYFGLNETAARIWELIKEPKLVSEVRDQLLIDYPDADPAQCTSDLLAILNEMQAAALVRPAGGRPG